MAPHTLLPSKWYRDDDDSVIQPAKTGIKDIIPLTDCYTFLSLPVQRIWLYINVSLRENFTYFPCSLLPCSGIANRLLNTFLKVLFKMNSKWISTFCTEVHINNKSHLELHSYHRLEPLIGISPEDNKINIQYLKCFTCKIMFHFH